MRICLNDLFACLGLTQTCKLLTTFSKNSFYLLPEPLRLGEFLTNYCLYNPTDIISMISADSFKVYLTGGATWDMMIDNDYSKNKTLLPDFGLGVIQKASYRVVPFSKSKDTREIKRVIIEDQQVKN